MIEQAVDFFTVNDNGEEVKIGSILYDGEEFTELNELEGDITLSNVLKEPVFVPDDDIVVDVTKEGNPKKWFASLHKMYTGSMCRATKPRPLTDEDLHDTVVETE